MPWCVNPLCGKTFGLEKHHVVHRSQLGSNDDENLADICPTCHRRHHDLGLLLIERDPEGIRFTDLETGETAVHRPIPQEATGPSDVTDAAALILNFLDLAPFAHAIRDEPDEVLAVLYDQVREIKHRAWQAQAAIIAELQERANYGDEAIKGIAERLGISARTAQYRGKIYREILGNVKTADVGAILLEESWYREAVDTDDPQRWIQHAADQKAENPAYSVRKFRADIAANTGETVSVTSVIVVCRDGNAADKKLVERLAASLRVPVVLEQEGCGLAERPSCNPLTDAEFLRDLVHAPAAQEIEEYRSLYVGHVAYAA